MREENQGLEFEVTKNCGKLDRIRAFISKKILRRDYVGLDKIEALNWPYELVCYSDGQTKELDNVYRPEINEHDLMAIGVYGFKPIMGTVFDEEERTLEQVVHPIVAAARLFDQFVGIQEDSLESISEWCNCHMPRETDFRTSYDPEALKQAVNAGYLRQTRIRGALVYFPTGKAAESMCLKRGLVRQYWVHSDKSVESFTVPE